MIILVDDRTDVTDAYRASLGREGVSAASFRPVDFDSWFHSTSGPDLAAVEAFILGDFDRRETVTRAIKTRSGAPAIALNDSSGLESTLKLFAAGADDVLRKPIHAREIIARIGAIRRRITSESKPTDLGDLRVFNDGRDPEVAGQVMALPRRERRILEYLVAHRNRRVTRNQIFNAVYGLFDEDVEESVVESHISKLRKKLRQALGYDPIDTKRYLGYQIVTRNSEAG
ncbi:response regulator transcription factor [Aestuariivirga sp.]|uniref:response regulator transcription factor n=1 Tax=Aestuariivirga sp. TaxID=2650926 RepID=UPI00391896A0